jgi:hypothetical protein
MHGGKRKGSSSVPKRTPEKLGLGEVAKRQRLYVNESEENIGFVDKKISFSEKCR